MVNSDFNTKHEHGYDSLWKWIGKKFVNILLSAVIFFMAVLLAVMTLIPGLYVSEAKGGTACPLVPEKRYHAKRK